jgi:glucose-6-phosphate dehydrogenase assembly protein OpcA
VSEDVWSEQDTHPDHIEAALRELLRDRHAENEALAPARVLNMIVLVDRQWKGEVANRLERAGRYHGSRTVLCAIEDDRTTLDAVASVAYEDPGEAGFGVISEVVEIDMGPEHVEGIRTIVDPVLITEMPTVAWSPHGYPDAVQRLLPQLDVLLLDSDDLPDAQEAFARAQEFGQDVYVVDLAWLRTTPWRERLAASFDVRQAMLRTISELEVRHREGSKASALLLAGWLASRLGWDRHSLEGEEREGLGGTMQHEDGEVGVCLKLVDQEAPGLAGVTVTCDGVSLSLQRGEGGLDAEERNAQGEERSWKILGASRGEGGILGEGVRQALLRDPTYRPALEAAQELSPA